MRSGVVQAIKDKVAQLSNAFSFNYQYSASKPHTLIWETYDERYAKPDNNSTDDAKITFGSNSFSIKSNPDNHLIIGSSSGSKPATYYPAAGAYMPLTQTLNINGNFEQNFLPEYLYILIMARGGGKTPIPRSDATLTVYLEASIPYTITRIVGDEVITASHPMVSLISNSLLNRFAVGLSLDVRYYESDVAFVRELSEQINSFEEALELMTDNDFVSQMIINSQADEPVPQEIVDQVNINPDKFSSLLIPFVDGSIMYSEYMNFMRSLSSGFTSLYNMTATFSSQVSSTPMQQLPSALDIIDELNPLDDIQGYTYYHTVSMAMDISQLTGSGQTDFKENVLDAIGWLAEIMLQFAAFFARIGWKVAKLISSILISIAQKMISITIKLFDFLLVPDTNNYYRPVFNLSPIHTPLILVDVTNANHDEVYANIEYNTPMYIMGAIVMKIPIKELKGQYVDYKLGVCVTSARLYDASRLLFLIEPNNAA